MTSDSTQQSVSNICRSCDGRGDYFKKILGLMTRSVQDTIMKFDCGNDVTSEVADVGR